MHESLRLQCIHKENGKIPKHKKFTTFHGPILQNCSALLATTALDTRDAHLQKESRPESMVMRFSQKTLPSIRLQRAF